MKGKKEDASLLELYKSHTIRRNKQRDFVYCIMNSLTCFIQYIQNGGKTFTEIITSQPKI